MRRKGPTRACEACGKLISQRVDGDGLRAHKCEHGHECVAPAWCHPKDGRTHNVPCLECAREREAYKTAQSTELENLVMALAFAIEDPCGIEAIKLAGELVRFGRAIPTQHRNYFTKLLAHFAGLMHELEDKNG